MGLIHVFFLFFEAFDHSKRVLMMESEMKRADSERRRMEFWFIS